MIISGTPHRTISLCDDGWGVSVIDQTRLPHAFALLRLTTLEHAATAIRSMQVRGAPLIGATAAYGMALAMRVDSSDAMIDRAKETLLATRPTAVNLRLALAEMADLLAQRPPAERARTAYLRAKKWCDDEVAISRAIGEHGARLIGEAWERRAKSGRVQILTHCNAGWLAAVDWGTALAAVYVAAEQRIPMHVWVDETRPRNQGAQLTAWELSEHGISHTVIVDNAGGHLMQRGDVDLCVVGTDRTTRSGDVCNKIGTYLKALAAADNAVPFYVAAPSTSIDWTLSSGAAIPIEERDPMEVHEIEGRTQDGAITRVRITPQASPAANYGFDVTPARLVTALITERGACAASEEGLRRLFPERYS